jgi:hypothetical protein
VALDRGPGRETLVEGWPADAVVVNARSHVPYQFDDNLVKTVLKGGERVHG